MSAGGEANARFLRTIAEMIVRAVRKSPEDWKTDGTLEYFRRTLSGTEAAYVVALVLGKLASDGWSGRALAFVMAIEEMVTE